MPVMNVDFSDQVILEGTSVEHLVPIDQATSFSVENEECGNVFENSVSSTLVPENRTDLITLLVEFQDVFAVSGECLGKCNL